MRPSGHRRFCFCPSHPSRCTHCGGSDVRKTKRGFPLSALFMWRLIDAFSNAIKGARRNKLPMVFEAVTGSWVCLAPLSPDKHPSLIPALQSTHCHPRFCIFAAWYETHRLLLGEAVISYTDAAVRKQHVKHVRIPASPCSDATLQLAF